MRIVFSARAIANLDDIFDYYIQVAPHYSPIIIEKILNRTDQLLLFPDSGPAEQQLKHLGLGHRYLVEGNYKIIYARSQDTILITHIFDARQNPDKL